MSTYEEKAFLDFGKMLFEYDYLSTDRDAEEKKAKIKNVLSKKYPMELIDAFFEVFDKVSLMDYGEG